MGYCTVRAFLADEKIEDRDYIKRVPNLLSDYRQSLNKTGYYQGGKLRNMDVKISDRGITITGSLNKYKHGNNVQSLTRIETKEAVQELADILWLNIEDAVVREYHFAENIWLDNKVNNYYNHLGKCQRYNRLTDYADTLFYRLSEKEKLFYDKVLECKRTDLKSAYKYAGQNIVRNEMRYLTPKQVAKIHNQEITLKDLSNQNIFSKAAEEWYGEYQNIESVKVYRPTKNNLTAKEGFEEYVKLLESKLNPTELQEAQKLLNFKSSTERKRFLRNIKELDKDDNESGLKTELDYKMSEVADWLRSQ